MIKKMRRNSLWKVKVNIQLMSSNLQWMVSFQLSSIALEGINGFSARQNKCLPVSSALGLKVSILVVMLPSAECFSRVFFNRVVPKYQLIVGAGREPAVWQVTSLGFPEEKALLSPWILTKSGRTIQAKRDLDTRKRTKRGRNKKKQSFHLVNLIQWSLFLLVNCIAFKINSSLSHFVVKIINELSFW